MPALREKSEKLTGYLEFIINELASEFPDAGISIITSSVPHERGSQLSLNFAGRDREFFDKMTAAGVIADFREPCMIRVAPVPLYNSFEDVYTCGEVLRQVLADVSGQ